MKLRKDHLGGADKHTSIGILESPIQLVFGARVWAKAGWNVAGYRKWKPNITKRDEYRCKSVETVMC